MTKEISYIHFSDLHIGQKYANQYLSNAKDIVISDLNFICQELKALDIVFFTGDMVQSGAESEYESFFKWFEDVKKCFEGHGFNPYYLFVPGNHDLERIADTSNSTHKMLKKEWLNDDELREDLIWNKDKEYYKYCLDRFHSYENFIKKFYSTGRKPEVYREGVMSGDFYAEIMINDAKIGIVGLNSAFLQVDGDNYYKKLGIYHKQVYSIFGDENYVKLIKACDVRLLLTHHEPDWYEEKSKKDYSTNIFSSGKFDEHLCGHNHVPKSRTVSYNYGGRDNLTLAPSLFGVELADKEYERIHGYHAGKYKVNDDGSLDKVFYPRLAILRADGYDIDKDPNYKYDNKRAICRTVRLRDLDAENNSKTGLSDSDESVLGSAHKLSEALIRPSTIKSNSIYEGVRKIEQEKVLALLEKKRMAWILSHFGLGEEEFVSSLLPHIAEGDCSLFVVNMEGVRTYEEFEHSVSEQFSRPLISLINNLSENYQHPVLMLNNIEREFVEQEVAALRNTLTSVTNFNKHISIIIVSYFKPSDAYFQCVELKPLDLEEVKHCLEAFNKDVQYKPVDIDRVHSITYGYPLYLNLVLKELELVEIEDLNESDFSSGLSDFTIPTITRDYILSLRDSSNKIERRCFSLLQLLAFLPKGETFKTISRFDPTMPYQPVDLVTLKDKDLIGTDFYYTYDKGKFIVTSSIVRIPRVYRDYIISLTEEKTKRDIYSNICAMYFGRDWMMKNDVNIYTTHKGEYCSFVFHNASMALRQLLVYSINSGNSDFVVRYLRIANQFIKHLSVQSFFYVANVIADELFALEKEIEFEEAKGPLAYLKYQIADIKRMNYDYNGAEQLFRDVLEKRNLQHQQILSSWECLGYIYSSRGQREEAVKCAESLKKECHKKDEVHQLVADFIKVSNKAFDNDMLKLEALNKLYAKAQKQKNHTTAVNVLLEMAIYDVSKKTLNRIEKELKSTDIISYDRMRLLSMKYKIMTSPTIGMSLSDSDVTALHTVYTYSFTQMLTKLMIEAHVVLWNYYSERKDYSMLVELMKYSSFVWEMQNLTDLISEYIVKIKNDPDFMSWIRAHLNDDDVSVLINERGL